MSEPSAAQQDPTAVMLSKAYVRLLVLCAGIGLICSLAAWLFLSTVPWMQDTLYTRLPSALGFAAAPWWWPLPVLLIAGLITAFCIARLPGGGGGVPAEGLSSGLTQPIALPGVLLAALATLGFGLVLGPSAPVIAIGSGVALLVFQFVKPDASENTRKVVGTAGTFAAFAMIFNNPIIAAVILMEASGLGGATLTLVLIPGLLAAGIGAVVYLGAQYITGLDTSSFVVGPLELHPMGHLSLAAIGWTVLLAALASAAGFVIIQIGRRLEGPVKRRPFVVVPIAGLVVASLAIIYSQVTGQSQYAVLFSGSRALDPLLSHAATLSLVTLGLLFLLKGTAWGISMGSFRGGPVFPAIFIGTVAGLLVQNLPGFSQGAAVPALIAATVATTLRLPFSAIVLAMVLTTSAGPPSLPLIIIAAVVAYLVSNALFARRPKTAKTSAEEAPTSAEAAPGPGASETGGS